MEQKSILTVFDGDEDARVHAVKSAEFRIDVDCSEWDDVLQEAKYGKDSLTVRYSLNIISEESEGNDGDLDPDANNIPVYLAFDQRIPTLEELIGKTISLSDADWDWDAWYGNDAPSLTNNKITFLKWENGQLFIRWESLYGGEPQKLLFEGATTFNGVGIRVKQLGDAEVFLRELFRDEVDLWTQTILGSDEDSIRLRYAPKVPLSYP